MTLMFCFITQNQSWLCLSLEFLELICRNFQGEMCWRSISLSIQNGGLLLRADLLNNILRIRWWGLILIVKRLGSSALDWSGKTYILTIILFGWWIHLGHCCSCGLHCAFVLLICSDEYLHNLNNVRLISTVGYCAVPGWSYCFLSACFIVVPTSQVNVIVGKLYDLMAITLHKCAVFFCFLQTTVFREVFMINRHKLL